MTNRWQFAFLLIFLWIVTGSMQAVSGQETALAPNQLRLITAVKNGDISGVQALLKEEVNVNAPNPADGNRTPLHYAITDTPAPKKYAMVDLLLTHKAQPNATDEDNMTPLMKLAYVKEQDTELVKLLLRKGADVTAKDRLGMGALAMAVEKFNLRMATLLIEAGADVQQRVWDCSLLFWTLNSFHPDDTTFVHFVQTLLQRGASVKADPENDSQPPLRVAISHGHSKIVPLLLRYGADPNWKNESEEGRTPLWEAVGDYSVFMQLIRAGASYRDKDKIGATLLFKAAESGNVEVCRFLLHRGLSVHRKNRFGDTPLMYAAQGGNAKIVDLLLRNKADPLSVSQEGNTALSQAALFLHADALRVLVSDPRVVKNRQGLNQALFSALELVAHSGMRAVHSWGMNETLMVLLKHGADLHARNEAGETPFLYAVRQAIRAREFYMPVLDRLLFLGADINATDREGLTALMLAARGADSMLVSYLLFHKARVDAKDTQGRTAFDHTQDTLKQKRPEQEQFQMQRKISEIVFLLGNASANPK